MTAKRVLGLDILPGSSPSSSEEPSYAVVILENEKVIYSRHNLSRRSLIKLINETKPDIVAVDNISELFRNKLDLKKFFRETSFVPKIIQVTKISNKYISLRNLIKKYNLGYETKISPLKSAEYIARLAEKGVGSSIDVFEKEIHIIISRRRSLGQGGMSSERFKRKINLSILRLAKNIKKKLRENNFDFDFFYRKTSYGLLNALFIVYSSNSNRVFKLIKPWKGQDIQIIVKPLLKKKIEFKCDEKENSLSSLSSKKFIIVGVDPGISTGLAGIDLNGFPLFVFSRKELGRNQALNIILEYGKPVLVATDVKNPPLYVKKIASEANATLFYPEKDMMVLEKRKIVQDYMSKYIDQIKVADSHQRDALAAAIKAYQYFRNKFEKLEAEIRKTNVKIPLDRAKVELIRGKSIKDILREYMNLGKKKNEMIRKPILETVDEDNDKIRSLIDKINRQQDIIKNLEIENRELKNKIMKMNRYIEELEEKISRKMQEIVKEIREKREIAALISKIRCLENELDKRNREIEVLNEKINAWKKVVNIAINDGIIPVIYVNALSQKSINHLLRNGETLEDRVIYVREPAPGDIKGAKKLVEKRIKAILVSREMPEPVKNVFEASLIPVISIDLFKLVKIGNEIYVEKKKLEKSIMNEKKKLERKRDMERERRIYEVIKEYREKRIREILKKG